MEILKNGGNKGKFVFVYLYELEKGKQNWQRFAWPLNSGGGVC